MLIEEGYLGKGVAEPWMLQTNAFALERAIADVVLRSLDDAGGAANLLADLGPIDDGLYASARAAGGAVYPDGFAVIGKAEELEQVHVLGWDPNKHQIEEPAMTAVQQVETEIAYQLRREFEGSSPEEPKEKSEHPLQITLRTAD